MNFIDHQQAYNSLSLNQVPPHSTSSRLTDYSNKIPLNETVFEASVISQEDAEVSTEIVSTDENMFDESQEFDKSEKNDK